MTKSVVPSSTAARDISGGQKAKKELKPSNQFIGATLNMSWQLAIVVLVPIISGYKIDVHFDALPVWTIIGFIIAMLGTFVVMKRAMDQFSEQPYKENNK